MLNFKIAEKLREMGYNVLLLSNLDLSSVDLSREFPNMFWPFGQHILAGAKIIRNQNNLYAIYLTSHGCGPDNIIASYFSQIMNGKPYLHLEVDEHSSAVGMVTRLEAFVNGVENVDFVKKENEYFLTEEKYSEEIAFPFFFAVFHYFYRI